MTPSTRDTSVMELEPTTEELRAVHDRESMTRTSTCPFRPTSRIQLFANRGQSFLVHRTGLPNRLLAHRTPGTSSRRLNIWRLTWSPIICAAPKRPPSAAAAAHARAAHAHAVPAAAVPAAAEAELVLVGYSSIGLQSGRAGRAGRARVGVLGAFLC